MFDRDVATQAFTAPDALPRPLCVDLDGTLIVTDTLWESAELILRQSPWLTLF